MSEGAIVITVTENGRLRTATQLELELLARLEAAEKDAARYRWLRDHSTSTWACFQDMWSMTAEQCDETIDYEFGEKGRAAMTKEPT